MAVAAERVRTPRGRMQIIVKTLAGHEHTLDVKRSDTIRSVKAKIQDITGFDVYKQRLVFEDTILGDDLLQDGSKLSDYNIQNLSSLSLVIMRSFVVFIKPPRGRRFPLVVNPTDLVADLRARVADHQDEVTDYVRLLQFGHSPLENGRTLADYNIHSRVVLHYMIPAAFEGLGQ